MGASEQPGKKYDGLPEEQYQAYLGSLLEWAKKMEAAMKQQRCKRHYAIGKRMLPQSAGIADIHKQTQDEGNAHPDPLGLTDAPVNQYQSNEIRVQGQSSRRQRQQVEQQSRHEA
jgi:hypothetical protein